MNPQASVTYYQGDDGLGWIIFDAPGARANLFDAATIDAFGAVLDEAIRLRPRAVIIISAKDRIFIAGADLKWVATLADAAAATEFARLGHRLFQRVADFPVPVVCAIHGAAAGGGLHLALACHWRMASDAETTRLGLPEIGIGVISGWGGAVRLARLIGVKPALDHILKAQLIDSAAALATGLIHERVPAAELKARAQATALRLAADGLPPPVPPTPPEPDYFFTLRRSVLKRTGGHQPAPLGAIEVLEQAVSLPLAEALDVEAKVFGRVAATEAGKNMVNLFFLRDAAKKRSVADWYPGESVEPRPLRRIGVIGAGVMGSGIAHWLAAHGREVVLRDVRTDLLDRGLGVVRRLFDTAVRRGEVSAAAADADFRRVRATTGWDGFAGCDLVIEAVVEDAAVKRALFSELAATVPPGTLLASNTSALPIEEIAGHVPCPGRTLGMHFFNPVSRMSLVELVLGHATEGSTAASALALIKALGKSPVICRSAPGFIVSRILFFYLNEAVRLWESGVATEVLDAAMRVFGWPMGPLRLIDEVGIDVADFIFVELAQYFPDRFVRTAACAALLAAALQGRKNGVRRGFYRYDGRIETVNDAEVRLLTRTTMSGGESTAGEVTAILMRVMVAEARRCLAEGVVKSPDDIDFALLSGAAFPAFRGGLLRWADRQETKSD